MSLITMVHIRLDIQFSQGPDSPDTQQNFLFQTIFPISSIQVMRDAPVTFLVIFEIRIQQIQFHPSDIYLPDSGIYLSSGECKTNCQPISFGIPSRRYRYLREILSLIFSFLITCGRKFLSEITVTIQQADTRDLCFFVTSLFQVISGQHAKTSRINFQRSV